MPTLIPRSNEPAPRGATRLLRAAALTVLLALPSALPSIAGTGARAAHTALHAEASSTTDDVNPALAEIAMLKRELTELRQELAISRARIAELERSLATATERLRDAGLAPAAAEPPVEEAEPAPGDAAEGDAERPASSPVALLRALQSEYQLSVAPVGGWTTPRERTVYFRTLEKWLAGVNRKLRAPIDWQVRIDAIGAVGDKNVEMRMIAIDPKSREPLGEAFDVLVPTAQARRLESGGPLLGRTIRLKGTLSPQARFNEQRESVGRFDSPPFIGPFCEFGFAIDNPTALPLPEA